MASPQKLPRKGILKTSSSFDKADHHRYDESVSSLCCGRLKETKWDEMNIIATLHPPDKDYGHMKIDEPPTPYNKYSDLEDEDENGEKAGERRGSHGGDMVDPEALESRLRGLDETDKPRQRRVSTTESSDDEEETEELKAKRMMFEQKRKLHYNEFQAVRLAQNLMEDDDDEAVNEEEKFADADDDDEENGNYQDVETEHNTLLNARNASPNSGSEENITRHQVQLSPGETLIE